jgi:hypothetical protein
LLYFFFNHGFHGFTRIKKLKALPSRRKAGTSLCSAAQRTTEKKRVKSKGKGKSKKVNHGFHGFTRIKITKQKEIIRGLRRLHGLKN